MGVLKKHILTGTGAAILLLLAYFGIITLAQGLGHALEQTFRLWYWVLALVTGFGIQVGLFSFIRQSLRQRLTATSGSVTVSGSISTGSMAACCAHHLSELLPFLGLSGLALFLVRYQFFFIIAGVFSNLVGITIMLETIQRLGLCPWVGSWKWQMGRVRNGVITLAVLTLVIVFVKVI